MASIRRRIDGGIYYARLRYKDSDTGKAKEKSISLMTTSEEIAMSRLRYVNRMESEIKSGSTDLSSIRFNKIYSYDDINNTGSEITTHDGYIYFIVTKEVISDMYKRVKIGYTSKKPSERIAKTVGDVAGVVGNVASAALPFTAAIPGVGEVVAGLAAGGKAIEGVSRVVQKGAGTARKADAALRSGEAAFKHGRDALDHLRRGQVVEGFKQGSAAAVVGRSTRKQIEAIRK